jgi:3-oxoacyl-[acyl-carrier-protein] synthase-3
MTTDSANGIVMSAGRTHAYIVAMGKFLPHAPVGNDAMEDILGRIDRRPSRARRITLRNSGIISRHYAIDPATGCPTHTNAQLAALAVRDALNRVGWRVADLDLLTCGTSSPDQLKPAHAHMVHGELGEAALEAVSLAGVCSSGMAALRHAELAIRAGESKRAACSGSELASSFMAARNFSTESGDTVQAAEHAPVLAFEKDFLRWMLSDGAGAALLAARPIAQRMALRIDWIEGISLAHREPVCMYSGAVKLPDGRLAGWRNAASPEQMVREHYLAVKQDARLLDARIPELIGPDTLGRAAQRRGLVSAEIDWLLPHYSSHYFRGLLRDRLAELGMAIPESRWFTNLSQVGNVGSASIFLMLEELMNSGRLARGQKILCFVPESARFSVYYMQLSVV